MVIFIQLISKIFFLVCKDFITTFGNSDLKFCQRFSIKESTYNKGDSGDMGSILGWGLSPGVGNGNPLQYSCLGNPRNRGAWWATFQRVTKSQTQLSTCMLLSG